MSESATTVEAPSGGLPPATDEPGLIRRYGVTLVFLAPTLVLLTVWVVYPTLRTIHRSFYDRSGDDFIGIDNYRTLFTDDALVTAMDEVRAVVSTALGLRKAAGMRVRQPLRALTVAADDPSALAPYADLLAAELNVKAVALEAADAGAAERFGITQRLAVNARAAGPRLGRGVQAVIQASRSGA